MVCVSRGYPAATFTGRITVITADPDILSISPLVVPRNPNGRAIGALPAIVFTRRRRGMRTNADRERGISRDVSSANPCCSRGDDDKSQVSKSWGFHVFKYWDDFVLNI
jgi:hypothetical protein